MQLNPLKRAHFYCTEVRGSLPRIETATFLFHEGNEIQKRSATQRLRVECVEKCIKQANKQRCYRKPFSLEFHADEPNSRWNHSLFVAMDYLNEWRCVWAINKMTCKNIYCRESKRRCLRWQFARIFFRMNLITFPVLFNEIIVNFMTALKCHMIIMLLTYLQLKHPHHQYIPKRLSIQLKTAETPKRSLRVRKMRAIEKERKWKKKK